MKADCRVAHPGVSILVATVALLCMAGCGWQSAGDLPPLRTVERVDVERYAGVWYEIAKYPNRFERGCHGVTAEYTLRDDGTIGVRNVCRNEDGKSIARTIEGYATIADRKSNAKLTVYFAWPFGAPYWIIDLDEDYTYAVVGEPSRRFLWILSRTPVMDPAVYEGILARLVEQGYDPARLEPMTQFPDAAQ
ncbi:MAG: lipocalin family protein [Phycisphaerales bacterium]|nr:lipocalin family protein [Phycisphaerales bacterium]